MAGTVELTGALERRRLRMWRSDAFDGILFSRGKGMTHPYPRHWHEEFHLCAYTAGAGYLGYGGNSYPVTEGDFVATPPGEVHENWVNGEAGISFFGMYVDADAFARASSQIAGCELRIPGLKISLCVTRRQGNLFWNCTRLPRDENHNWSRMNFY
jgi:hypothetical protein